MTIFFALTDNFFALTNHCSVKNGSIIEFDLSPYGTLFFIFSSLTKKSFSFNSSNIFLRASNLSNPTYSLGALLLILPGFFTDTIGFLLLIPFTRKILLKLTLKNEHKTKGEDQNKTIDGEIVDQKKDEL